MLIDSHAHLEMPEFKDDLQSVIKRARQSGMTRIITIGTDLESSYQALELAGKHDFIYASVGYHPHNADNIDPEGLKKLTELAADPKVVGWGEIGLDFFRMRSPKNNQLYLFEKQLEIAIDLDIPIIIHDRDAHDNILEILGKKKNADYRGVIHCFSGDIALAETFLNMGFFISIPGIVTYKKAGMLQEVAKKIPLDRMLIETDCPYLAPVPKRGKRNEPVFVKHTAKKIAELRGMEPEEIEDKTAENAIRLFGL